jgi:hypothetical protein
MGHGPQNRGKAIGLAVAGLAVVIGLGLLWVVLGLSPVVQVFGIALAAVLGAVVARSGWTLLGNTLLAYGIAARVPVALIMLVAIHANWGTHYELGRPDLPPLAPPILKWFVIGLVPQMFIWIPATILVGTLFGSLAAALVPRPKAA